MSALHGPGSAAGAELAVKPPPRVATPGVEALSLAVASGVPTLLWGPPGSGKTSVIVSIARSLGWAIEVVIGSIREPSDLAGLPVVHEGSVRFSPPSWAKRLAEQGCGLLFLDELTTAPPAVQAAMLRVVVERVVGDIALPDRVRVVAAANPPDQAADGWELAAPLANRLVHLDWAVQAGSVADGLALGWPEPNREVLTSQPTAGQRHNARASVAAFLRVRPDLVLQLPAGAQRSRGWPSPRSWEAVATLLATCEAARASEDARTLLVLGAVGEAAAIEFLAWLENLDLPDPLAVLADPDGFELPERSDRAWAALSAVTAVAVAANDRDTWLTAWRVVARAAAVAPDVAALAARTLALHRPDGATLPTAVLALVPVLRGAGLLD